MIASLRMTDRYAATLVFQLPDGAFMYEPIELAADDRAAALALAMREARGRAFGRELMGLSRFGPAPRGPLTMDDIPEIEVRADASLLEMELPEPAPEPERRFEIEGLSEVRWWEHEGAFGPASEVGLLLARVAARDETLATESAELVGEWIAHQTTLYPVTSVAWPFFLELIERADGPARDVLEGWAEVLVDAAYDDTPVDLDALRAEVAAIAPAIREIMFPNGVEARMAEGRARQEELRAAFEPTRPRLARLATSRPAVARVLARMGDA